MGIPSPEALGDLCQGLHLIAAQLAGRQAQADHVARAGRLHVEKSKVAQQELVQPRGHLVASGPGFKAIPQVQRMAPVFGDFFFAEILKRGAVHRLGRLRRGAGRGLEGELAKRRHQAGDLLLAEASTLRCAIHPAYNLTGDS